MVDKSIEMQRDRPKSVWNLLKDQNCAEILLCKTKKLRVYINIPDERKSEVQKM